MSTENPAASLKALGEGSTRYDYPEINAGLLEWFPSPFESADGDTAQASVEIVAPEFTCLCPKTGQPDFATIKIDYIPRDRCVESKSLKLYLGSFRKAGIFHEYTAQRIAQDLFALLEPQWLEVKAEFTPRGGIKFWPTVTLHQPFDFDDLQPTLTVHPPVDVEE